LAVQKLTSPELEVEEEVSALLDERTGLLTSGSIRNVLQDLKGTSMIDARSLY
jgi:hypothetical protein